MPLSVDLMLPNGTICRLPNEAIIGRMTGAALRIDDPRISEAHALVSARGAGVHMLALRGRMSLDGKPVTSVPLSVGTRVVLAGFHPLEVVATHVPEQVPLLIHGRDETPPVPVFGVLSLFPHTDAPIRSGFDPSARAHLWHSERGLTLREGSTDRLIALEVPFRVDEDDFTVVSAPYGELSAAVTVDRGRFDVGLELTLRYDTATIVATGGRACLLDGLQARAIAELHAIGSPVAWQAVAALLWQDAGTLAPSQLRSRWDQLLLRIRAKLKECGIRLDLVRSSRPGLVELMLGPRDTVIDET